MPKKPKTVTLKLPRSSAIVKLSLFEYHMGEIRKLMCQGLAVEYAKAHDRHLKNGKDLLKEVIVAELGKIKIK